MTIQQLQAKLRRSFETLVKYLPRINNRILPALIESKLKYILVEEGLIDSTTEVVVLKRNYQVYQAYVRMNITNDQYLCMVFSVNTGEPYPSRGSKARLDHEAITIEISPSDFISEQVGNTEDVSELFSIVMQDYYTEKLNRDLQVVEGEKIAKRLSTEFNIHEDGLESMLSWIQRNRPATRFEAAEELLKYFRQVVPSHKYQDFTDYLLLNPRNQLNLSAVWHHPYLYTLLDSPAMTQGL